MTTATLNPTWSPAETTPMWTSTLDALRSVSLAELDALAALQTRVDRKYMVPEGVLGGLLAELGGTVRALEIDGRRAFGYESVYFDTADLRLYRAAAHGRPRRVKVRTRTYVDSGLCMLEVKVRDVRGRTVKHRHPCADGARLADAAPGFLAAFDAVPETDDLTAALTTRFVRATLLVGDGQARATIDTDLRMQTPDGAAASLSGFALVETKSAAGPSAVDRLLWARHLRPVRVSKYGAGLAAVRHDLPGNRWYRVVRHYLSTERPEAGERCG